MKPLCIEYFTILSAHYNYNNYSLDLSTAPTLNVIYNTFYTTKIKPNVNNNSILFWQHHVAKPGPAMPDKCKIKKVIAYCVAPKTKVLQCKVHWLAHSPEDHQSINAKCISSRILRNFGRQGSVENRSKICILNNSWLNRRRRDKMLLVSDSKQGLVISVTKEEAEITTNANNIAKQIFDLFPHYQCCSI